MYQSTVADKKLENAREHIKEASADLYAIVVDECEGSAEFDQEMMTDMEEALHHLICMGRSLSGNRCTED